MHFSSDLYVLRPTDPLKGNGVLLFEVANRGRRSLLGRFNRAAPGNDPTTDTDLGDGLLMRDGYTLVWIGWEIDVPAPLLRIDAPPARLPAGSDDRLSVEIMHNERVSEAFLVDDPAGRPPVIYLPADSRSADRYFTVRDRFWDMGETIPRDRWRFVVGPNGLPKLRLDTGFEPGSVLSCDLPRGRASSSPAWDSPRLVTPQPHSAIDPTCRSTDNARTLTGVSQAGRFLRQFLYEGSMSTSVIAACSMPCGSISLARREVRSTSDLRRPRSVLSSRPRSSRLPMSSRLMSMARAAACSRATRPISARNCSTRTRRLNTGAEDEPRPSRTRRLMASGILTCRTMSGSIC